MDAERKKVAALLKEVARIAAIYRINAPLNPPDDAPMERYTPGAWPVMGDLRRLMEAAEEVRSAFGIRAPRP